MKEVSPFKSMSVGAMCQLLKTRKRGVLAHYLKPSEGGFKGALMFLCDVEFGEHVAFAWGRPQLGELQSELCLPAWEGDGVLSMRQEAFSRAPDMTARLEPSVWSLWDGLLGDKGTRGEAGSGQLEVWDHLY